MVLSNAFYPRSIHLPSPDITHFTSVNPDMGYQYTMQRVAGLPTPRYEGVSGSNPTISFTTQQIKSVLDTCTVSGLCKDLSGDTVDMYYRAGKPMEIREDTSSSVHVQAQLALSSMIFWESISVRQGSVAELGARIVTAKRGAAEPLVWVGSTTLPTATIDDTLYGMGPVYLNSSQLTGVTGFTINNNVELEPIRSDGERALGYQGIRNYSPQITLSTNDMNEIADATYGGDAFVDLVVYLRKMSSTNVYVDSATAEHIKITYHQGLKTVPSVSGSPAELSIEFRATETSSNPTHTIDTASTIV